MVVAQGGEQQEQEEYAAPKEPLPVFFHKQLKVHKGTQQIDRDAQENGDTLDGHRTVVLVVPGGGEDQRHAEAAGQQAEGQKHQIPFFQKLLDGRE